MSFTKLEYDAEMEMEAVELQDVSRNELNENCKEPAEDSQVTPNAMCISWNTGLNESGVDPRIKIEFSQWHTVWTETAATYMKVPEIRRSHQNGGKPMYLSTFRLMSFSLFRATLVLLVFLLTVASEFIISYLHWFAWGCRNMNFKLRVGSQHESSKQTKLFRNVCRISLLVLDIVFRSISLAPVLFEIVGTETIAAFGFVVIVILSCSGSVALQLHAEIRAVNSMGKASILRNCIALPQNRHNLVGQEDNSSDIYDEIPISQKQGSKVPEDEIDEDGGMVIVFADAEPVLADELMGTFHNENSLR